MKLLKRLLIFTLISCLLLIAGGIAGVGWYFSNELIHPQKVAASPEFQNYWSNPAEYGLALEPFSATTYDGLSLNACMIRPNPDAKLAVRQRRIAHSLERRKNMPPAPAGNFRGTILLLHGSGTSLEHMFTMSECLTAAGFQCIAFDARAHGKSEGDKCTWGYMEKFDTGSIIKAAESRFGQLGPVGILGFSMGSAVALQSIPEVPQIRSVVAIAPFATLRDAAWRIGEKHTSKPWLYGLFASMDLATSWREGFRTMEIAPVAAAANIKIPALLVAGENDLVAPPSDALRILEALQSETKKLTVIANASHDQLISKGGDSMMLEICEFFALHNHLPVPDLNIGIHRKPNSERTASLTEAN